uniref:Uncharacterized protein n=1 Tax=Anopheles melas TaxID=34690 RepID=A0A182TJN6_9DIPT
MVVGFPVESAGHHARLLSSAVHSKIPAQKVLTTIVLEALVNCVCVCVFVSVCVCGVRCVTLFLVLFIYFLPFLSNSLALVGVLAAQLGAQNFKSFPFTYYKTH